MSNKQEMLYGLCMVALALQLTAVCTDHWSVKNIKMSDADAGADINMGLWKGCGEGWAKYQGISGDSDVCLHLPIEGMKTFPKNALQAARVFAIMGIVLVFVALVCMMYMKNYKKCQLMCLLAGGLSSLIAMAIWSSEMLKIKIGDNSKSVKFNPGYSFYLNLVGGLAAMGAAAYYYYGK